MVVQGTVKDIASVVRNGSTIFYIVMDNKPWVVFSAPDSVGPQVALRGIQVRMIESFNAWNTSWMRA
jgi:hypothetical protein